MSLFSISPQEALLLRHHHEAESLFALQKLEWEWAMPKDVATTTNVVPNGDGPSASTATIDELTVPMVTEFDMPARL